MSRGHGSRLRRGDHGSTARQTRSIAAWAGPCDKSVRTVPFFEGGVTPVPLSRLRLTLVAAAAAVGLLAEKSSVSKNGTPIASTARRQNAVIGSERTVQAIL